jgi:hypothetical protein
LLPAARSALVVRLGSLLRGCLQAEFLGDPFDGPVQLDAPAVRGAAEQGRDVG